MSPRADRRSAADAGVRASRTIRQALLTVLPALVLAALWFYMGRWYRERAFVRDHGQMATVAVRYAALVERAFDAEIGLAKSKALGDNPPRFWDVTWIEMPALTPDRNYMTLRMRVARLYGESYQVASTVSVEAIIRASGIAHAPPDFVWSITDAGGTLVYGPDLASLGPVAATIRFPGSFWHLEAVPSGGWDHAMRQELLLLQGSLGVFFAAILSTVHYALRRHRLLRRQADSDEAALRLSEASYRELFDSVPDPLLVANLAGEMIAANRQARERLGLTTLPATLAEILMENGIHDPDLAQRLLAPDREACTIQIPPDGLDGPVYYEVRTRSSHGSDEPERLMIVLRDVTEATLAEQALSASEARYRDLVESSPEGIMLLDVDGRVVMANQRMAEWAGYAEPTAMLRVVHRFRDIVAPHQRADIAEGLLFALKGEPVRQLRLDITARARPPLPVEASIAPILDGAATTGVVVALADVSQRERVRRRNRAYRAKLASLARELGALIDLPDSDQAMQQIANAFLDLADARAVYLDIYDDKTRMLTPTAFAGDSEVERVLTSHLDAPMLGVARPMIDGWHRRLQRRGTQRLPGLDGIALGRVPQEIWPEVLQELGEMAVWGVALTRSDATVGAAVVIMDRDTAVPFVEIVEAYAHAVTDLMHQRRASAALQESEARYRSLITNLGDAVILLDSDLRIVEFRDTATKALGLTSGDAVGGSLDELLGPLVEQGLTTALAMGTRGHLMRVHRQEALAWRCDKGDLRRLDASVFGFRYRDAPHAALLLRDVTDRERLYERLRERQRLEDLGRLAAGAAHDLRHVVALIKGEIPLIAEAIERDPAHAIELLAMLDHAVFLGESFCTTLVEYGQDLEPNIGPLHMNLALCSQRHLMETLLGDDLELAFDLAPGYALALADAGLFERAWLNLLVNARDAMRNGGCVTIATRLVQVDEDRADELGVAPGPYAMLSVADAGPGMTQTQIERAFSPYYSTKEASLAAGLGLSVVKNIVECHDGCVAVRSSLGVGTTFDLYFPAVSPDEIAESADELGLDEH